MDIKRLIAKGLRNVLQPPALTNSTIDKKSKICSGTNINDSTMDRYSYIGHDCFVLRSKIGPFVSIADNCRIGGGGHPLDRVSTSPVFHEGKNILKKNFASFPMENAAQTVIGADVWIAADVVVLSGVNIGVGAVVGTGSVVTKDIPPYEIWAGNPARKIRDRFDEDTKNKLLESQWWLWSRSRVLRGHGHGDAYSLPSCQEK